MRELVEEDGGEEQQTCEESDDPVLGSGPLRIFSREGGREQVGEQAKYEEPTGIQEDGDTEDFSDLQAASHQELFPSIVAGSALRSEWAAYRLVPAGGD